MNNSNEKTFTTSEQDKIHLGRRIYHYTLSVKLRDGRLKTNEAEVCGAGIIAMKNEVLREGLGCFACAFAESWHSSSTSQSSGNTAVVRFLMEVKHPILQFAIKKAIFKFLYITHSA